MAGGFIALPFSIKHVQNRNRAPIGTVRLSTWHVSDAWQNCADKGQSPEIRGSGKVGPERYDLISVAYQ